MINDLIEPILIGGGIGIVVIVVIGYLLDWFYHRATKEVAFVRTGFGGEKVIIDGGAFVFPILHEIAPINLNVVRIPVARMREDAVSTRDRMRIDIQAEFFVRIAQKKQAIAEAASALGKRAMDPETLSDLLGGKFVGVLRSSAVEMTLDEIHERRSDFLAIVEERAAGALARNGLELESVAITDLDQTDLKYYNPSNRFDAEGMTQLIDVIETRRRLRNDIEQSAMVAIRTRNLEAEKETLRLEQESEALRLEQERAIEEARIHQQRELKQREIEREMALELSELTRQITLLEKQSDAAKAQAETERAKATAAVAEEQVITAREKEIADRNAEVDRLNAQKDADTTLIAAEAEKTRAAVAAEALRLHNEADNLLTPDARSTQLRAKLIDRLEGIIRESVRPLEKIEGIRILQVDGFGSKGGNAGSSPTDEVIDSALRYRAQAPLIDQLMKDIGIENPGIAKMGDIFRSAKDAQSLAKQIPPSKSSSDKPSGD